MERNREKDADDLLDVGIAAIRNNMATNKEVEEAASRVARNLQIEPPPESGSHGGSQGEPE